VAAPVRKGAATAFAAESTTSSLRQLVLSGNVVVPPNVAANRPMLPALAPRQP
jgi:hypothetical protein